MQNQEIMIVDDDRTTLKLLEHMLVREGFSSIPVAFGKEAVRIARERQPSLILLDIMMPDLDGGEVARLLRSDARTKDIPIIFVSSLVTEREEEVSGRNQGIFFVAKPPDRRKLLARIREFLDRDEEEPEG